MATTSTRGSLATTRDADLAARGYTGNPNLLFFETHADLGGPIVRDRAWFYGFYNHFRIDKAVSGVDQEGRDRLGRLRFSSAARRHFV